MAPNAVASRLGYPYPMPVQGASPAMLAGQQDPSFGTPTARVQPPAGAAPSTAPVLPTEVATPLYDVTKPPTLAMPTALPYADGWQGALQRALVGFSKGASQIQVDPTFNPLGAGLVGGAEAAGNQVSDVVNRKLAAQQMALAPFKAAQDAAMITSANNQANAPTKAAEAQTTLDREIALQKDKFNRDTDPALLEPLAQHIATLAPSLRRVELGKQAGPVAMALAARVDAIRRTDPRMAASMDAERQKSAGLTDSQLEEQYQREKAGEIAGATYEATTAQGSARAAQTVQGLLPGLKAASDAFSRTDIPLANTVYAGYDKATGGDRARGFQQYLTDTKLKMSSALMNGGMPQQDVIKLMADAFPDNMNASSVEGSIARVNAMMENQKRGALTPASLTTPPPVAASVAAPVASGPKSKFRNY